MYRSDRQMADNFPIKKFASFRKLDLLVRAITRGLAMLRPDLPDFPQIPRLLATRIDMTTFSLPSIAASQARRSSWSSALDFAITVRSVCLYTLGQHQSTADQRNLPRFCCLFGDMTKQMREEKRAKKIKSKESRDIYFTAERKARILKSSKDFYCAVKFRFHYFCVENKYQFKLIFI